MQNTWSFLRRQPIQLAFLLAVLSLLSACSVHYDWGEPLFPNAPPLTAVNDWLYRGSQPTENTLKTLKGKGVKTIVNFRTEPGFIEWERREAESLGMKYISLSWEVNQSVDPVLLDRFFEILDHPENRPVFIHCKRGRDRTGVMTTLALMRYQKLPDPVAREIATETIRPTPFHAADVKKKIDFFIRKRPEALHQKSSNPS